MNQSNAVLLQRHDQESRELYKQVEEARRDIDFERAQFEGLQERYHEVKAELNDVKTELARWHENAAHQVRQEGTSVVVASCMTLEEAEARSCRWDEDLSIWMRSRDGTYRKMAPKEVTGMQTTQKLRELAMGHDDLQQIRDEARARGQEMPEKERCGENPSEAVGVTFKA